MKHGLIFVVGWLVVGTTTCLGADPAVRAERRTAQGKADANTLVTLEDYLRYGAMHNAGLKAAFERWRAAVEQVPQAEALPDPRFSYSYFMEEIETRVGSQKHRFGLTQTFPWFGEIEARTDAAAANAKVAGKQYEAAKLKLFYEVKDGFYEYAYLAKAVKIASENLELVKHFEEVARTKYRAAAASHPDVIRAQVELAKLEDNLRTLQEMRRPIVARLNAVLNRPHSKDLPWPERPRFQPAMIDHGKLTDELRAHNPELQALDFQIAAATSTVELAKKKFYPSIGVGVDWIQTDEAIMPGVRDSGKDPVILMFSLNLPIWRDSYKAAEEQAKANIRQTLHAKSDFKNSLLARIERVLFEFADSNRKANLYGDILVPKAEELLSVSETAYKGGTIDFLSLIDAQRTLLQYQLEYERAVTNNLQRLAELEMLAGAELATSGQGSVEK